MKAKISPSRALNYILKNNFTDIVPNPTKVENQTNSLEILSEISKNSLNIPIDEYNLAKKIGSDLYLTAEKRQLVQSPGFFFNDLNENINLDTVSYRGWKLNYLRNMLLLQDYDNIFREYLQNCARNDQYGLELVCEPRYLDFLNSNLNKVVKAGYQMEIESLKIRQEYKVLRIELYKNLKVNRYLNKNYHDYNYSTYKTPLGPLIIAAEPGKDRSLAMDNTPFILATTVHIKTPLKLAIFNQNMKRKIHGKNENETIDYVVRFESQFTYSDFTWILPVQNKPKRIRQTKITDFNNCMRGNPYFENKFDLINDEERFKYMARDSNADQKVLAFIYNTKRNKAI